MPSRAVSGGSPDEPSVDVIGFVQPQPRPINWGVGRIRGFGYHYTVITRYWDNGAPERCRLCPRSDEPGEDLCCSVRDVCTITVLEKIPQGECEMYDTTLPNRSCVRSIRE
jgi:hypothetical protein